jgi:Zn-finger nucleic acid-binding protein
MNCPACKVAPGQHHETGCDVEVCARCGGQAISCGCIYEVCEMNRATLKDDHPDIYRDGPTEAMYAAWDTWWDARRIPWTGEWPGVTEAREFGWYCRRNPDRPGYLACAPDHPQALPDLNRLSTEARWDANKQRYVLPEEKP